MVNLSIEPKFQPEINASTTPPSSRFSFTCNRWDVLKIVGVAAVVFGGIAALAIYHTRIVNDLEQKLHSAEQKFLGSESKVSDLTLQLKNDADYQKKILTLCRDAVEDLKRDLEIAKYSLKRSSWDIQALKDKQWSAESLLDECEMKLVVLESNSVACLQNLTHCREDDLAPVNWSIKDRELPKFLDGITLQAKEDGDFYKCVGIDQEGETFKECKNKLHIDQMSKYLNSVPADLENPTKSQTEKALSITIGLSNRLRDCVSQAVEVDTVNTCKANAIDVGSELVSAEAIENTLQEFDAFLVRSEKAPVL